VVAKVSSRRIVRIVGSQERTRKIAPLNSEALAGLQERLEQPPGFKSYKEIVDWLNQTYQLNLTYPTVYKWVHYRLKAKLKVPRPKSAKQEPDAVRRFKKTLPEPC
jgi:transposase